MKICGLKLTHDGSVAMIENGKLIFSVEMEKIKNNKRYTEILDTGLIQEVVRHQGHTLDSIDHFALDGWGGYDQDALAIQPRLTVSDHVNSLTAFDREMKYELPIAQYQERSVRHNILEEWKFDPLKINQSQFHYSSFLHVTGHVLSAYCTSEFARNNQPAYVLVWDGGMYPRLYFVDPASGGVENLGPIFLLIGNVYTIFSQHFGPFKVSGSFAKDSLSVAGKVMAYIALGEKREELLTLFEDIYKTCYSNPMGFANTMANECKKRIKGMNYSDEDILLTFHIFLEELLVEKIRKKVIHHGNRSENFCYSGGCALNIKWNSAIRNSGIFKNVYVPPFPNDSGSAIGAACGMMVSRFHHWHLDWNVYSGPAIIENDPAEGWIGYQSSLGELAMLLHDTNEPVVFLNGNAELGPRALGNRSILAAAHSPKMKDFLNKIKLREGYRPVSPICLEEASMGIFEPGIRDPYMLFDHVLKSEWIDRVPAVRHLDGTSRLQTINFSENKVIAELLERYCELSGIPLLCNTSANLNGSGFFPDVFSATNWNGVNYVWCNGMQYERKEKLNFEMVGELQANMMTTDK